MDTFKVLEASISLMDKSEEMAVNDPHGIIITIVSVSVVFASLIILYFAYSLIGKISNWKAADTEDTKISAEEPSPEVAAAISMALHEYVNENSHDRESYVITIKRTPNK